MSEQDLNSLKKGDIVILRDYKDHVAWFKEFHMFPGDEFKIEYRSAFGGGFIVHPLSPRTFNKLKETYGNPAIFLAREEIELEKFERLRWNL